MHIRLIVASLVLLTAASGCDKACTITADCNGSDVCVATINRCRKPCQQPGDCSGATICKPVDQAQTFYACLNANEGLPSGDTSSHDTSLGNQCVSPKNDGVSQPTDTLGACGDNAPLCNTVFAGDQGLGDVQTCTTECSVDSDCAHHAPANCLGDCARDYANLCCFPSLPVKDSKQYSGAKTSAPGQPLKLYCRPRLFCYLVPKRCATDTDCGKAGSRAGDKCTIGTDGGGACLSGKLGLYECCQRQGECDQATAMGGVGGLSCEPSLDNVSGYCTKPCAADSDCASPMAPNASCWTTTFETTSTDGQCRVVVNPSPICRNQPKPALQSPATKLVPCDFTDRPSILSDNSYNSALRRCDRTF
jgi:hypothetical protein